MNTPKTLSAAPVQTDQDVDLYGLRADMIEPSYRYTLSVPAPARAENTSQPPRDEAVSFAKLRLPRRHSRTRVSDLLD